MTIENKIKLLNPDHGFVLFRYPGDNKNRFISGRIEEWSDIPIHKGFVFTPFNSSSSTPRLIIRNDKYVDFQGDAVGVAAMLKIPAHWFGDNNNATSYDDYSITFNLFHKKMVDGDADKIILSKIVRHNKPISTSLFHIYDLLCERYPAAFVYIFASSKSGVWMGASPELLLKCSAGTVNTVALAGTRSLSVNGEWRTKEMVEHEYVSDFIAGTIRDCGVDNFLMKGPDTVSTGTVAHLKTEFEFDADDNFDVWNLAEKLHPTPAISGFPKHSAVDIIVDNETHAREYYAGYMGFVGEQETSLYVNLRCMKVTKNGASLYVGGGLTVDSKLDEEWGEAELKAKTLLSVLENI